MSVVYEADLGKMFDRAVAKKHGLSRQAVSKARRRLGIAPLTVQYNGQVVEGWPSDHGENHGSTRR